MTDPSDLTTVNFMPPLTDEEFASLKADIQEHGILMPVLVDLNGEIVDGFHRYAIATELEIACPKETIPISTEGERIAMSLALNAHRRQLTKEQRDDIIRTLRERGMSTREVAKAVNTSKTTAARSSAPNGTSDIRRRPTPEQIEARDAAVLADLAAGMKQREVAEKHGIHQSQVSATKARAAKKQRGAEPHLRLVNQRGARTTGLTLKASHRWFTEATGTIKGYSSRMAELHEDGSLPALYLVGDSQRLFDDLIESTKVLYSTVTRMERERRQAHVTHNASNG